MIKLFYNAVLILLILFFQISLYADNVEKDTIFQVSTISSLLKGVYEGEVSVSELKENGNFGIGTYNYLDGEMVGIDGEFYKIKDDGKVYLVSEEEKTPFAVVTFFDKDDSGKIDNLDNYKDLQAYLDTLLPSENIYYAIKIEGIFDYIKTRSVPKQKKPYKQLTEVIKEQPIFEFNDIKGTLVGFKIPLYIEGLNVTGYHMHFISSDKKSGGHLLECKIQEAVIELDYTSKFYMTLLENKDFLEAKLIKEKVNIDKIEKQ